MAVKKPVKPRQIKDYWPQYRTHSLMLIFLNSAVVATVSALFVVIFARIPPNALKFWCIVASCFIASYGLGILLFYLTAKPLRDLLAAITHIAGERSNIPPPRPSDELYQNTSFGDALQLLYELASTSHTKPTKTKPSVELSSALNDSQIGFIILDSNRNIRFATRSAPLKSDNGDLSLQLLFNGDDSFDSWLEACEANAVHAEKIWSRVADRSADQEGQRLFDIYASYSKGTEHETILTLIDRTAFYQNDEEDLNFISFAAHELRGPITVIRGYLDVLQDELGDVLADDQRELFRRLTVSANRLSSYINNILNTSRYDRRHLSVTLNEDTVQAVYDTIRDDMELRALAQNRLLSVGFPSDLPTIAADRASLGEVLGNLIDNAIKYSNEGGAVTVSAAQKGDFVDISVADRGIGMPGNVVSSLFNKFYRSHRSRETVAGTGIGLYISKAIVESHGGTISVRSTEGEGSTFTVSLPTYASVAEKLQTGDNTNKELINQGNGWIKNHSMYRG